MVDLLATPKDTNQAEINQLEPYFKKSQFVHILYTRIRYDKYINGFREMIALSNKRNVVGSVNDLLIERELSKTSNNEILEFLVIVDRAKKEDFSAIQQILFRNFELVKRELSSNGIYCFPCISPLQWPKEHT